MDDDVSNHQPAQPVSPQSVDTLREGSKDEAPQSPESDSSRGIFPVPVHIEFRNLSYEISSFVGWKKVRRPLLQGVSGCARPNSVLAIMGPTGSGKTTLLNALAVRLRVREGTLKGSILVNGQPHAHLLRRYSSYVLQEDAFLAEMTVRETITTAAFLRLPKSESKTDKRAAVDEAIAELGLGDAANTRIGNETRRGISGGERKRTSIAAEMIGRPSVIYLDEPTTGLDSFQALNVMTTLNDLASNGRTVICTIHQPRSKIFDLFDRLLLLHAGRPVYFGPAADALTHFANLGYPCPQHHNPSDFLLDLISIDVRNTESSEASQRRTSQLVDEFADQATTVPSSPEIKAPALPNQKKRSSYPTSWLTQFVVLSARAWLQTRRSWWIHALGALQGLFLGVFGGALFKNAQGSLGAANDVLGLLFFVALFVAFETSYALINFYPPEKVIVTRERAVGSYRASAYYLSKMASTAPLQLIPVVLFGLLIYYIDQLNSDGGRTARFFLTISISGMSFATLGLAVSSLVGEVQVAAIVCCCVNVTLFLVGGFLVRISRIPWVFRWLTYVSPFTWSFAGLVINEFQGMPARCGGASPACLTGDQVVALLDYDGFSFWETILYQCLLQLGLHLLAYATVLQNMPRFTSGTKR